MIQTFSELKSLKPSKEPFSRKSSLTSRERKRAITFTLSSISIESVSRSRFNSSSERLQVYETSYDFVLYLHHMDSI